MTTTAQVIPDDDDVVRLKVSWTVDNALVEELGDNRHARLTYDGETLEIMSPGSKHERIVNLVADTIASVTVEWSINRTDFRSTTFQTKPRGEFEADKAYDLDARPGFTKPPYRAATFWVALPPTVTSEPRFRYHAFRENPIR